MPNYFFVKLNPPRPTFPADITPDELAIMEQHADYWTDMMRTGFVIVFGPVFEPNSTFGMGVFEAQSEEKVWELVADDPAKKAGLNHEVHPMRIGGVRGGV